MGYAEQLEQHSGENPLNHACKEINDMACKQQNRHRSRRESAAIHAANERVQYAVFGATSNQKYDKHWNR